MTDQVGALLFSAGLNAAVVLVALWRRSLSPGGALAAFLTGAAILYFGGFLIWGMLILFFVSSSVMSRVGGVAKARLVAMHEKDGRRDAVQVLANGGPAVAASILYGLTTEPAFAVAAAGGLAAANADTWASELGVLSSRPPRSVVTRRELEAGTSGGVTPFGTMASIAGSALVAIWFALWTWARLAGGRNAGTAATSDGAESASVAAGPLILFVIVAGAGALGSFIDSVIGGSLQALYQTEDGGFTERRSDGVKANRLVHGVGAITNDVVNFVSTLAAATLSGVIALLVGGAVG